MATINRLVTQLAVDPSPMEQGFARGLNTASRFAESIAPILQNALKNPARFQSSGEAAANKILDAMTATFNAGTGVLREALARGAISPEKFTELGAEGARAFNTSLLNTISQLDAHNAISPEQRALLIGALKDAGLAAGEAFSGGLERIGQKLRSLGRDFVQFGIEASLIITAPLVEGARKAVDAAEDISHATDKIAVSTGAVGPELDALNASFLKLFSDLPNSAQDIAKALSGITVASGATGPALEALATQALNLSRITGTDLGTNIDSSQRAFKAWGTAIGDQATNLDFLFKVSQRTGVGVSTLSETLAHFAPSLKEFGLSFQQSAALVGEFEKNGINADAVLTTLQTSLARFAEKGIDGAHALQKISDELKAASTPSEATDLASRIVGPRLAAQLANAARSGALDFQQLTDAVRASGTTIDATAKRTDAFGQAQEKLSHASELARREIGENLERAFILVAPTLTSLANGVGEMARKFNELPTPLTATIVILLALAAAVGPIALALGGLARAAGAVTLILSILSKVGAGSAVAAVGTEAAGAAVAMDGAATAAGSFATGLALIGRATLIGAAITAIILIFEHFTNASREAAETLDKFKETAQKLSQTQIDIDTSHIQERLRAVESQAGVVRDSIQRMTNAHLQTGGALGDALEQLDALERQSALLRAELRALEGQSTKNADAMKVAAAETAAFQSKVAALITVAGSGITIDGKGEIKGSLVDLQRRAKDLTDQLARPIQPPTFDVATATSALDSLEKRIRQVQDSSTEPLGAIFDKLSPSVETASKQVEALVQRVQALPHAFQQLADIRLSRAILADLDDLNGRLNQIGRNTVSLNADKLRASIHSLEGLLAAQLGGPQPGSKAFEVTVTGSVKEIKVDPSAGVKLLEAVSTQLTSVHDAAERAAAAEAELVAAQGTNDLERIARATVGVQEANTAVRRTQDEYRAAVERTGAAATATALALKTMLATASEAGANQTAIDAIHISLEGVDPDLIKRVHDNLQADLVKFGPVAIDVVPITNRVAIERLASDSQKAINKAALLTLAGDTDQAALVTATNIDRVARSLTAVAQNAQGGNSTVIAASMEEIARAATDAKIPVATLQDYLHRLTDVGQRKLQIDLAGLTGDANKAAALQKQYIEDVAVSVQDLARAAAAGRLGAFEQLQARLKDTGVSAADVAKALDALTAKARVLGIANAFKEATAAIFGTSSAVGALLQNLSDVVISAIGAAKAIEQVHAANDARAADGKGPDVVANIATLLGPVGKAVATIGSFVGSVVGSLIGESAIQKEHDAALKSNSDALIALTASLDREAGTAGRAGQIAEALAERAAEVAKLQAARDAAAAVPGALNTGTAANAASEAFAASAAALAQSTSVGEFTKILATYNLTIDQAVAAAKTFGITLLDSNKNFNPGAVDAFNKALAESITNLTTFGDDLATQQKKLAFAASIAGGNQSPAQKLNDSVAAIAATLDSHGGTLGKQLEAANAEGPAALRKFLTDLFAKINSGFFTTHITDLGSFKDVNELLDAMLGTSDAINALGAAAGAATDALLNVPAGFKRALTEFNAQTPQTGPTGAPTVPQVPAPPPTDTVPTRGPDVVGTSLHSLLQSVQDHFATPLEDSVAGPTKALERLTVSATDVADALDAMFHMKQSALSLGGGSSSDQVSGSFRFDPVSFREAFETFRSGLAAATPATGSGDVHIHGDLYVDARDKPADELFATVKKKAQQVARQKTGDSTRVLDAFAE